MKRKFNDGMKDFNRRAAAARGVATMETFTGAAMDWLRIAAFAGFDTKQLVRRIVTKKSSGEKFNAASVQNMMQTMSNELPNEN